MRYSGKHSLYAFNDYGKAQLQKA